MKKRILPLIAFMILSATLQAASADQFLAGVEFQSRGTGGYLVFDDDFNASRVTWANNIIIFVDFENAEGAFGDVGFDLPAGINVTVTEITPTSINQTVNYTSAASYLVYVPEHGIPSNVSGIDPWYWIGGDSTTSMTITENSTIVINWDYVWYQAEDSYAEPSRLFPDLINQYLPVGDITGFIISPYTMTMGVMFFPLVILMFIIPSQQRLGIMMTGVIMILGWTTIEIALFPQAINLVNIIMRIALAGAIVYIFFARRRPIG